MTAEAGEHMSDAALAAELLAEYMPVPLTDCVVCGGRMVSMFVTGMHVCAAEHRKHQQGITDNHREASKQFPKDGDERVVALLAEVRLLRAELRSATELAVRLAPYAEHEDGCDELNPCPCGLTDWLEGVLALQKREVRALGIASAEERGGGERA